MRRRTNTTGPQRDGRTAATSKVGVCVWGGGGGQKHAGRRDAANHAHHPHHCGRGPKENSPVSAAIVAMVVTRSRMKRLAFFMMRLLFLERRRGMRVPLQHPERCVGAQTEGKKDMRQCVNVLGVPPRNHRFHRAQRDHEQHKTPLKQEFLPFLF